MEALRTALEHEAERVAARELHRHHSRLASLPPAERETITATAHRLARAIAVCLLAEAESEERLAVALRSIYRTPAGEAAA